MATPTYKVDENDKRLTAVTAEEKAEINKSNTTYDNMIADTDKYYKGAINDVGVMDENGNWNEGSMADIQTDAANQRTEFAIQEIERNKEQARKDYLKEQSAAYGDYIRKTDPYGVEAERIAAMGLTNSGYSESVMNSMYNTYQNRVATTRASYDQVIADYNVAIAEARVQNSSVLAEIATNAMKQRLELTLQGFQYKNQLILDKASKQLEIKKHYATQWQTVYGQILDEYKLNEQARQADMDNKIQQQQLAIAQAAQMLDEQKFAYQKQQDAAAKAEKEAAKKAAEKQAQIKKKTQEYESKTVKTTKNANTTTYNKAAATMQAEGAIKAGDGGLMTATEWKRRKNSGSNRAELQYATYQEYVDAYTNWRIANPEK